jgi:hypothetical protein
VDDERIRRNIFRGDPRFDAFLAEAKRRLADAHPDDPRGHELVEDMVSIAAQHVRDLPDEHERVVEKEWQDLSAEEVGHLRFLASNFVTAALRGMV